MASLSSTSAEKKEKTGVMALDTITTRFFMLFVFMLTVPMAALSFFSASIIRNDAEQDIQQQIALSQRLFDVHLENRYERLLNIGQRMAARQSACPPDHILGDGWVTCWVLENGHIEGPAIENPADRERILNLRSAVHRQFLIHEGKPYLLATLPLAQRRTLVLAEPLQEAVINPLFAQGRDTLKTDIWIMKNDANAFSGQLLIAQGGEKNLSSNTEALIAAIDDIAQGKVVVGGAQYHIRQDHLYGGDGKSLARVAHILPLADQQALLDHYFWGAYMMGVAGLIFAIVVALLAGRPITQPLLKLIEQVNNLSRETIMQGKVDVHGVQEINQLNSAFNRMFERLREEQKMKDEFVATLTHDLKVPLIAEKQTLAYMLSRTYGPLTEIQEEVVDGLKTSNESCLSLVNGILQVYRYESGQMTLMNEPLDMIKLLDEAVAELKPLAEQKNITLTVQHGIAKNHTGAFADRLEIKRVLHNLVSNAITNTTRGGKVQCRTADMPSWGQDTIYKVSQFQHTTLKAPLALQGRMLVSVEDTGVGFSPEELPHLFRQFAVGKGRNPMSLGLGLYNCYQVVHAHNGSLWVETTEGEGSAVCFLLPVDADTAQERRKQVDRRKNA